MPITQDRFIALLSEAEKFRDAYDRLKEDLFSTVQHYRAHPADPSQILDDLMMQHASALRPVGENIAVERRYFDANYRRNAKAAERTKRIRQNLAGYQMEGEDGTLGPLPKAPYAPRETHHAAATVNRNNFSDAPRAQAKDLTMSPSAMAAKARKLAQRPSDKDFVPAFVQTKNPMGVKPPMSQEDLEELEAEAIMADFTPDPTVLAAVEKTLETEAKEKAGLGQKPDGAGD